MAGQELPLTGVRVVEMTHMVMGPTCGMILAQLGADVIKVEPPAGDKTRTLGGMGTAFFPLFNRGKRSVVLDLAKPGDQEVMHRLLASSDVFLENFRDGLLETQTLGADELRRRHPHLIVTGHKGFLSGPYEHRPALDEVVQMMSGLAAMTGTKDKPQRVGSSANDIMGGMFGAIAILAALYQRRGNGEGANIRVGLFENCLFLVAQHMVQYEITGIKPLSMPEREHAWPIYDIFETADAGRIFIGAVTEGHWTSFCREFGLKDLADDPGLRTTTDRILARDRIVPRVAEEVKRRTAAELSATLDRLNICFSPINRPEDLFDDPHVLRPGGLVHSTNVDGRSFRAPALPIEWNGAGIGEGLDVPALGADTAAVISALEPTGRATDANRSARQA
jgi:crotonobetainyl-CoA:carnitine CoA-transferase CaiB-like acyl-CoA transferase